MTDRTPEVYRRELIVTDATGGDLDWMPMMARDEAIELARKCGGKVTKVTSYIDDREEIFNAADEAEDEK